MSMDLKSFRAYDEHEVVNLYSTMEGVLTKGTAVEYVVAASDTQNSYGDQLSNVPQYAYSADYVVNWKVQGAQSGSVKVAGILLKDVAVQILDPWTIDARFVDPAKLAEKQVVPSGRAVPFLKRGTLTFTGLDTSAGAPAPGSGLYISNSGGGVLAVGSPITPVGVQRIGTCMTTSGAYGSVVAFINCDR